MEILERREEWFAEFQAGWLNHYKRTGQFDWSLYKLPKNSQAPSGAGIDLSKSRLMLVSSAGGYLREEQQPFDAAHDLGDYSIRTFPSSTAPEQIAFAHDHYDHAAVDADQQVLLPLGHLEELVQNGVIGELAPSMVSFMGYQPIATRVVDETTPRIVDIAKQEQVDAVLLVPA